jgi:hypothetical protein
LVVFSNGTLREKTHPRSAKVSVKKGDEKMIMSTVVAVALGLTPVQNEGSVELVRGDYSASVGRYTQFTDRRGTTYVKGNDRLGVAYELVMDKNGYVEGEVGDHQVSFRVQEAG